MAIGHIHKKGGEFEPNFVVLCRDDYETLLALDDNNHQHTGATANQINQLPQSTVQVSI